MAMNHQVDEILDQVDALVRGAQKKHLDAFFHSGSESYTVLAKNLLALSRVVSRVHNALELVEEDPHFIK